MALKFLFVQKCQINIQHKMDNHAVTFVVADTTSPPLLKLKTCQAMNLVQKNLDFKCS